MQADQATPTGIAFRAFLSHRCESPDVNEYFFQIFSAAANPQFGVDQGTVATSVTRLERLIRSADAFIGVYPFPEDAEPTLDRRKSESQYFRLELGLAERASKPAIVFIDSRFGNAMAPPPEVVQVRFKHEEIVSYAKSPRREEFESRLEVFCKRVVASRAYHAARASADDDKTTVGLLVPHGDNSSAAHYSQRQIELIRSAITQDAAGDVNVLEWPPVLDSRFAAKIAALDWAIVDLGAESAACGIVAYLHGRFIPMMRLRKEWDGLATGRSTSLEATLFGAYQVGYPKDIVRWSDEGTLQDQLAKRIKILYVPQKLIATLSQAQQYFRSAARRNGAIFLSYSGKDADDAALLSAALKRKFQQVFDYRDKDQPIPAGASWIAEIFQQLAASPIGVLLLSPSYLKSGHCRHEAREMLARRDAGDMKLIPIKLQAGQLDLPGEFTEMQYLRAWEQPDASALVDAIVSSIDATPPGSGTA